MVFGIYSCTCHEIHVFRSSAPGFLPLAADWPICRSALRAVTTGGASRRTIFECCVLVAVAS